MKKPLGRLYKPYQTKSLRLALEHRTIIAVGDAAVRKLAKLGRHPYVSVYDLKTKRRPIPLKEEKWFESLHAEKFSCVNPAGYITPSLEQAVQKCLKNSGPSKLFVIGEEDLAALVFLIHAKSGVVCYGQPGKGLVVIEVNEKTREEAKKLYSQFKDI